MNFLKSTVANHDPIHPIKFKNEQGQVKVMSEIIKESAPELYKGYSYWVHPLLASGHTQTAFTALNKFENIDQIWYKREIITVEDKTYSFEEEISEGNVEQINLKYDQWKGQSTFAVDYVTNEDSKDFNHFDYKPSHQSTELPPRTQYKNPNIEIFPDDSKPLLIALHGLSGGSFESYVRSLLTEVTSPEIGFDALVINSRGCAKHSITSPQLFCGLWTNDLRYFINEHVKKRWPKKKIFLIGFSLGGSIAANYVGQEKGGIYENIKGAFIMGSPWDFSDSSYVLRESLLGDRVYSPVMGQNLLKLLNIHCKSGLHTNELAQRYAENPSEFKIDHLRDFDDNFTCKLFGFNTSMEYYRHASPSQRLNKIRVPTLILNSLDDPVVGSRSVPVTESPLNPYTSTITTTIGGHLGWFNYKHDRWYSKPVAKLMKELSKYEQDASGVPLPLDCDKVWKYDRLYYG